MEIQISKSGSQLSENDVLNLEKQIGQIIPLPYRNFLLIHNGGSPKKRNFKVRYDDGRNDMDVSLDWFLGINVSYGISIEWHVSEYQHRLPSELFPIATDPGGNLICISSSGEKIGAIYYWDHEEENEDEQPPTYNNVYLLADTFDDFLNLLQ